MVKNLSMYKSFLAGSGLGLGYLGGLVYGTAKDFIMAKAGEALATGDLYSGLIEAVKYGQQVAPEAAVVGMFVSLAVGLQYQDWLFEGKDQINEMLFGNKDRRN